MGPPSSSSLFRLLLQSGIRPRILIELPNNSGPKRWEKITPEL